MKKKILVAGAGRSATAAIRYLLDVASEKDWEVIVADANLELARKKVADAPAGHATQFDITDPEMRARLVG
ncbi:MAG: saccharopine dehydrogenase, partial [Deltaproteobacteria bacterium]